MVAAMEKMRFGNRKLHIVSIIEDDVIVTIAPLCIEKQYGTIILRSILVHFSDWLYSKKTKMMVRNLVESELHREGLLNVLKNNNER